MTILILNWRDIKHPLSGGAEICLLEHAKYWQKKGASIIWFAALFRGAMSEEVIDNILYIRRGSHFTVHVFAFWYYLRHLRNKIDIVIDNFHFVPFFTPFYINHKKIIALIHEVAGSIWFLNIPLIIALLGYTIEPLFFKFYKDISFITVSNSTRNELSKLNISQSNIHVIYNGVGLPKIKPKDQKTKHPSLLFLNRISLDKGAKDALKAFKLVKRTFPAVKLTVAGKNEPGSFFKDFLKEIHNSEDINYRGYVSDREKWKLIKQSWLLIYPSKKEGWGLTVIEAASCGTPTIAYSAAGLSDSVQQMNTGILTQRNTPESLASAAELLFNNKKLYRKLSSQAKDFAKQFKWEKSGEMSFAIIKNQLSKFK